MIHTLRKQHRYTWIGLALLLPLGFILAFVSIPEKQADSEDLGFGQVEALIDLAKSAKGRTVNVNLRKAPNKREQQLEIVIMHPLKVPAATVYLSAQTLNNAADGQLLGQLGPKGIYRFNLDTFQSQFDNFHLLIYDHIKRESIEQISL